MTPPCVVPTFRPYAAENLEFGGFYASSCESRANELGIPHRYEEFPREPLSGSIIGWTKVGSKPAMQYRSSPDSALEEARFEPSVRPHDTSLESPL